mgnify:CR=1 FL=1
MGRSCEGPSWRQRATGSRFERDGSLQIDVRVTLVTDDGASILMQYKGIGTPDADGHRELRTAPQFETGDDRSSWLNDVQAVGIGKLDGTARCRYDLYQLV